MAMYESFAQVYDKFMDNVPYDSWAWQLCRILSGYGIDDGLVLDLEFKRCTVDGVEVKLARKEFELLAYLISNRGKICSREQILSRVWSDEVVVLDRTIDVNITRLRAKIGEYSSYIVTRSGFGYGFRD